MLRRDEEGGLAVPSDVAVAAEASRVRLCPWKRDVAGHVSREPDPVPVDEPYLGTRQHPVAVDERAIRRALITDRGTAGIVNHHRRVPSGHVVILSERRGY